MLITGEGMYVWGKGVYWEISISLSSFAVNLKLLYKNKSYEEKKKKEYCTVDTQFPALEKICWKSN